MPTLDWLNRASAFTIAKRCVFGTIVKDRAGVGMAGQLDALLA
jgi:hypothetical protein